jgi:hypothetical protein
MKPMGYNRHKYSGELYKFVEEVVGDTATIKYYFVGVVPITAGLDDNQRMTIRTDEAIQIGSLIARIRDANGELILDDMVWQVSNISPVLNAFNAIDSYRLRAVKYQGVL